MKTKNKSKRKLEVQNIIALSLLVALFASVIYSLIRFIIAPESIAEGEPYEKVKSDYLLMLLQCLLGVIVMSIPSLITHKLKLFVPNFMIILYYVFLYCAIILGEIFSFYYRVPHWDTVLHAMSAAMLATLGFILIDWLNKDEDIKLSMNPVFVSLFAFSFALTIGTLWEIYEFSFDSILGLNMQKFKSETGEPLIGSEALSDTMKDLIIDTLAALAVAILGLITNIKRRHKATNAAIAACDGENPTDSPAATPEEPTE